MSIQHYHLGGPLWACRNWRGSLYPRRSQPAEWFGLYSRVFNTVEGNSTFYALPDADTIRRWREEADPLFRFCFKVPREVTHDAGLMSRTGQSSLREFLRLIQPLHDRIGMLLVQLPPGFGGDRLPELERFLVGLHAPTPVAVEPRHPDFFDRTRHEPRFDDLLRAHSVNRALFDTMLLHSLEANEPHIIEAQSRKPRCPERFTLTGRHPVLRFVGHNHRARNEERLDVLAGHVAAWLRAGLHPFVFLHSPDDIEVPALCRMFHQKLVELLPEMRVGWVPDFPGEAEPETPTQLELFDV